ncbi:MAG: Fic family protein, partial [Treponema sp.]|nr:Fic family protein [Treponema sp.]
KNLEEKFYHPLIVIGIFIVVFLAIHPFQDGNGRLSRALTSLLLLKNGYTYIPYSSLEAVIEANKDAYYRALRRTQSTLGKKVNYESWFIFFLTALQKQKRYLEEQLKEIKFSPAPANTELSRAAEQALALFAEHKQLTVQEIADTLSININTIKKTVQKLSARGLLVKHGVTRGAWYERR